jgi:hypothetical protein
MAKRGGLTRVSEIGHIPLTREEERLYLVAEDRGTVWETF